MRRRIEVGKEGWKGFVLYIIKPKVHIKVEPYTQGELVGETATSRATRIETGEPMLHA